MKRLLHIIAISLAALLVMIPTLVFLDTSSAAVTGNIRQKVLPLDCVFEIVNDGTDTIIYITPEECGVIVPPEVIDPDPISPTPILPPQPGGQTPPPTSIGNGYSTFVSPGTTGKFIYVITEDGRAVRYVPNQPVNTARDTNQQNQRGQYSAAIVTATVVAILLMVIGCIVLIILS